MKIQSTLIPSLLFYTTSVVAVARTSAPSGCLVVSKNPPSGGFKTIQAAINALSVTSVTNQCVFIDQGTYYEQVYISDRRAPLVIYGYTTDTSGYYGNKVLISNRAALATGAANDDMTATVRVWATNFAMYNVNVENTFGSAPTNGQALAISASADKQQYLGVVMKSYQDTLMAQVGRQFYGKCYIEGATDFIFGQHATAWFDGNDIRIIGPGYVTASGRNSSDDPSIYVINNSNIQSGNATLAAGKGYLGRPWGDYARVVVQNTLLSNIINPDGWRTWMSKGDPPAHATFLEYNNRGDGAAGPRVAFSAKATSATTIDSVLGSDYKTWINTTYLS